MTLPPIGVPINGDCSCCGLPTTYTLRDITESPACLDCKAHRSDPNTRDATHRRLWSAKAKEIHETGVRRINALKEALQEATTERDGLRQQVATAYLEERTPALLEAIDSAIVTQAEHDRETAYRREAELLSILIIDIEPLHRGKRGPASKCTCGKLTADCDEWQVLEPLRAQLHHVESVQLQRWHDGQPFNLPHRHPRLAGESWLEFKGLPRHFAVRFDGMSKEDRERLAP